MASERTSLGGITCVLLGCVTLAVWLMTGVALAAPSAAERETARSLMDEADRLSESGDLRSALSRYQSAHAIMHVPTTGLDLARTQAQLGLLVEARGSAMEVVNLPVANNEPRVFTDARRAAVLLAAELEPKVPSLTTLVSPTDATYTLRIDGVSLPQEARGVAFKANPGSHTVSVEAPGYEAETRQVTLVEGQAQTLSIALLANTAAATTTAPPPAAIAAQAESATPIRAAYTDPVDSAGPGRVRGIIGLSIGGAALATGLVTGFMSVAKTSHEKEFCDNGHCLASHQAALSSANTLANVANVTIPIGLIGIAYGLYELFTLPSAAPAQVLSEGMHIELTGSGAVLRGSL